MANESIKCSHEKCAWEGHIIVKHLKKDHQQGPLGYQKQFPGAQLCSSLGKEKLRARRAHMVVEREKEKVDIMDLFKLRKDLANEKGANQGKLTMNRFASPTEYTPDLDKRYVFPDEVKLLLLGLALPERNRVWIGGYSGTGKTQMVHNALSLMNHEMFRLNGDSAISRAEMIGEWKVREGSMVFQYGIIPIAMRRGATLLIDEIDSLNPHTMNTLRPVLEDPARLVILENGGEVIKAHPDFRVVATANTFGAGDDSGLFQTTNALSVADRQRFSIYVKLDYLPQATEKRMLKKACPDVPDSELDRFIQVASAIRKRHMAKDAEEGFSPRQLINWAEKFQLLGDEQEAAAICFLNSYPDHMRIAVSEIIKSAWDDPNPPHIQTAEEDD